MSDASEWARTYCHLLFMMIRLALHDGHRAIELLHEDDTNHLVGEGHLGEREFFVAFVIDISGESVWTTNDEYESLADCIHLFCHPIREFDAAKLLAMLIEQNYVVARLELLQYEFSFLLLLLFSREVLRVSQFGNGHYIKSDIVLHAVGIFVYEFREMLSRSLAY